MSETLPPITGTGVLLNFVFPFDSSLSREAGVYWQSRAGQATAETHYADIVQSGEGSVVLQQVTFPGDTWVVREKGGAARRLLALHVATGEREQRVVVGEASRSAAAAPQPTVPAAVAEDEDEELAAAIRASLLDATPLRRARASTGKQP